MGCPSCGNEDYVGYEVLGVYDGVLYWVCPKCDHAWARFTELSSGRLTALSAHYADRHNQERSQASMSAGDGSGGGT